MPISSTAATVEKKKAVRVQSQNKTVDQNAQQQPEDKNLLQIAPALPVKDRRNFYVRSHSTINASVIAKLHEPANFRESVLLQTFTDESVHVSRLQEEKEAHPDRISLDRRGLTLVPFIDGEPRLRLLSLQHNLINNLESLSKQSFPTLVFLDIYDNQLEQIQYLSSLENLRVLLMGKNRIKKIEGLENLRKIEVLDLHGNQISHVGGLASLTELKVLNLAGNQIKCIGLKDLCGLESLQELNLRRNRLKKLLGFADTPNLSKLFLSNNDLQSVEDISSLAKSSNLKEISIDNNPVSLGGDCVSFLVSYLPQLTRLNAMQITDQVRKAAMAWRRNKESTNTTYMDLASDVSLNYRREEVISNARTNWELLRSQTKCLTNNVNTVDKTLKNLKPDSDFVLTSLAKINSKDRPPGLTKSKSYASITTKVPVLHDKKRFFVRTPSQDTENSQNTSSSNNSGNEYFKLPPILVPIINRMEQKTEEQGTEGLKLSGSLSSIGANVDSSVSSLASGSEAAASSSSSSSSSESDSDLEEEKGEKMEQAQVNQELTKHLECLEMQVKTSSVNTIETSSNLSVTTSSIISAPSISSSDNSSNKSASRSIKSAVHCKNIAPKFNSRASTAKSRKQFSPALPKDREQGGDYLIEICGSYLNIYGQGALRFVDKPWNNSKAQDVVTVKFNYVNFNTVSGILTKIKHRFPNIEKLVFKETNITCLGQINALAEVQGLTSLFIDPEGNSICEKDWQSYAIYRLAHWGLRTINDREITEDDIKKANEEYQSLSDLVLWSLPDVLLQPLLMRLRIDVNHGVPEHHAKKWLLSADPELKSVVSKEALQWKKGTLSQEDNLMRQKAKQYMSGLLDDMTCSINKLALLEQEWPNIMHGFVQNTLLDYSQLDMYMKQKIQELNK